MSFQIGTIKLFNRLWFYNLIIVLLLSAQFIALEHSTEHLFHVHTHYCLNFQTADASPSLIASKVEFKLPEHTFEVIFFRNIVHIVTPFINHTSIRAPPVLV